MAVVLLPALKLLWPREPGTNVMGMLRWRWEQLGVAPEWSVMVVLCGLAVAALAVGAVVELRAAPRRALAGLGVVVALAFALRWMAPDVPHDINDRSIGAFYTPLRLADYGWGHPSFMATLLLLVPGVPQVQWTLFHFGPFLGAFTAVAVSLLARAWGAHWGAALAAGALFAVATPAVRFGHTDTHALPESLLFVAGVLALVRHGQAPRLWRALAAGIWLSLAVAMRPEGALLLPFVLLVAMHALGRSGLKRGSSWLGAAVALPALLIHADSVLLRMNTSAVDQDTMALFTEGGRLNHALFNVGVTHLLTFDPTYTHPWIAVLFVGGAILGAAPRGSRVVAGLLGLGLALIVPGAWWTAAGGDSLVLARHQLRAIPFVSIGAAFGLGAIWARAPHPALRGILVLGTAAAALAPIGLNYGPRTYALEHQWARQALPKVPTDCVVLYWQQPGDWSLNFQWVISSQLGMGHRWVQANDGLPPRTACEVWYRSANCSVVPLQNDDGGAYMGNPQPDVDHCREFEAAFEMEPIDEAALPAVPYVYDDFAEDPVRVGIYRVLRRVTEDPPAPGALAPGPDSPAPEGLGSPPPTDLGAPGAP